MAPRFARVRARFSGRLAAPRGPGRRTARIPSASHLPYPLPVAVLRSAFLTPFAAVPATGPLARLPVRARAPFRARG